jgi:hypothetical protein
MNPVRRGPDFARRMLRSPSAALLAVSVAACAQAPGDGSGRTAPAPTAPAPSPARTPEVEATTPAPKLRGIKPAELPREEPGVGLGGLTHEPAQPAQPAQ